MRLKPKAARRLLLISVIAVLAVASVVALVFVRSWQNERRTQRLRADGMAAFRQADYLGALDNLSRYLRRESKDREAWLAFGESLEHVEEAGGKHLLQAAGAYERARAMDESDAATGLKLLRLYNGIGRSVEARDLAVRLRPSDINAAETADLPVLFEEAAARCNIKAFDQNLDKLTQRLLTLDPRSFRAALLRANFLIEADRKSEAQAFSKSLLAANPGDPRYEFMEEIVQGRTGRPTDLNRLAGVCCRAAGLDLENPTRTGDPAYSEVDFASQLLTTLDGLGMYRHSLLVLKDVAVRLKDPDARRLLARRQWQGGVASDVLADFPDADLGPKGESSDILAFRALALIEMGRKDESKAVLAALRTRERDYSARAWSNALAAIIEAPDAKQSLSLVDAAIKEHPGEPVFLHLRAEVLRRLGRADEARDVWESVYKSPLSVGWATPGVSIAESLLDEGRLDEGYRKAEEAWKQWLRSSSPANLVYLRAQTLMIEAGRNITGPDKQLAAFEEITRRIEKTGNPQLQMVTRRLLLPSRVALLVADGRADEARALVEQSLSEPDVLDADLVRRLSMVSLRLGLGFESRLLAAGDVRGGGADTLVGRAMLMDSAGNREGAIALVDAALAEAASDRKAEVAAARARFYDIINHPDALKVWKSVVQTYPDSLPIQLAAIRSVAAAADPEFIDQLATRVTQLGGSDVDRPSTDIRFARARAMLYKSPSAKSRDDAVAILRTLVLENPSRLDLRDVLISSLLLDDPSKGVRPDPQGAIEQLNAAAAVAPDRAPYTLRMAEVLLQQDRADDAATQLSSLALDRAASLELRIVAADRLAMLRETDAALAGLDAILSDPKVVNAPLLARRASLLASLRRDREAADAYRRVIQEPMTDAGLVASVAAALRSLGDPAGAAAALAKLDDPAIKPQDRALARAAYAASAPDPKGALAEYSQACELAPEDPRTWVALARFHLANGELEPARTAASRGLEKSPDNPELAVVLQQAILAGQEDASADLLPLADALAKNPATARRAEAIRAIAASRKDGRLDDAAALVKLADEFVDDATTQLFVVRRLNAQKPPRTDSAAPIAQRALNRFPGDAAVQEEAARTLIAAGKWDQALVAATAWRSLTRLPAADVAVAEVQLALGRARLAQEAIRDLSLPATMAPDDVMFAGVLNVRVRSAVLLRDVAGALKILRPYLDHSAIARTRIALPIASTLLQEPADVQNWITLTAASIDPASVDEQLAVALAWANAGARLPASKADYLQRAVAVTDRLVASQATSTAAVFEARAALFEALGDLPAAIAAARKVVELAPKSVPGLVGLGALLLASGADPAEIESLARRAAELDPAYPKAHIVLSRAQLARAGRARAAGDQAGSAAARKDAGQTLKQLVALAVADPRDLIETASLCEQLDENPAAISFYERALASPSSPVGRSLAEVKNNLAFLLYLQSNGSAANPSLRRAKTLIEEAIAITEFATFYDTLGSINAALSDRPGAITAFRKALSLDPKMIGSAVGLAQVLASGTADERSQAVAMIKSIESAIAAGAVLDDLQKRQLEDSKKKLAAP